jgi:hypothetical protein
MRAPSRARRHFMSASQLNAGVMQTAVVAAGSIVAILATFLSGSLWPWEAFLRQNYLGPDTESGYSPTYRNRFRTAWVGMPEDLLRDDAEGLYYSENGRRMVSTADGKSHSATVSAAFRQALDDVLACAPHLRPHRDDLFPWEIVPTEDGAVTSFFMNRYLSRKPGYALHLSSFIVMDPRGCTTPDIQPKEVDLDYGGPNRQVWDLLTLRGDQFVIVACHEYEEQSFEVYGLAAGRWKRVLRFAFATLGS